MKLVFLVPVAVAVMSVGCSERQQETTKRDVEKATKSAERELDATGITTSVKTKLAADVRLSTLTSIHVETTGTTVTLTGRVPTSADKKKAEETARSVDGVKKVVNLLDVAL